MTSRSGAPSRGARASTDEITGTDTEKGPVTPTSHPPKKTRWRLDARQRRRLAWGVAALALLILLVLAFRPSPLPVQVAEVTRGPLEVTIDADGMTRVVDRYSVAAPVTGRLQRLSFEQGDAISRGQILARIAPAPLDLQALAQARAAAEAAEARLAEARARVEQAGEMMEQAVRYAARIREIASAGGVSVDERERAEVEAEVAVQEHEAAQTRVDAAASDLLAARAALFDADPEASTGGATVDVLSPASGRILQVHEPNERVIPAGTPIVDVGGASGLEVVAEVLSTDAVKIRPGDRVRIEEWGGEGTLESRVRVVEPAAFTRISALGVEEQRVNVVSDLLDPPDALGDQYRVEAHIVVWEAADVVKVPAAALFRNGEVWAVFTVERKRAALREVVVGQRGTAEAQVIEGLAPGETVILFPSDQLEDGMRVRPEG